MVQPSAAPPRRKLFLGTFIHSVSLDKLEYLHGCAVFVGHEGLILRIEPACDRDRAESAIYTELGWSNADPDDPIDVTETRDGLDFFFPGFVDTHIHAPQYPNAGVFGKSTLLNWLDTYTFPAEAAMGSPDSRIDDPPPPHARRVYAACVRRTLAHGTTTACYFATIHVPATNLLADLCLAAGQRALVGRVCMDRLGPPNYLDESPADAVAKTEATIAYIQSRAGKPLPPLSPPSLLPPLVEPCVTPRFAPACSPAMLSALGALRLAHPNIAAQTHVSENVSEVTMVRREYEQLGDSRVSYVGAYARAPGLLGPRTVMAHGVWLSGDEADTLAAAGAGVAHCPCSNGALTSGEARVRWLLGRGVGVGLGTDVSGGWSASVLEAARQAVLVSNRLAMPPWEELDAGQGNARGETVDQEDQRADPEGHQKRRKTESNGAVEREEREADRARQKLSVEEVLHLATRGGAHILGLGQRVGGFEVGMEWDAQLVGLARVPEADDDADDPLSEAGRDEGNVDIFGWESWDDRVAKWLYNGDDRNTKMVWVRGRLVHARQ